MLEIVIAKYIDDFRVEVVFNDGTSNVVDFGDYLAKKNGKVFEPLKVKVFFSTLFAHPEFGTLSWQNEIDIAPEFVYFLAFKNEQSLQEKFKEWGCV